MNKSELTKVSNFVSFDGSVSRDPTRKLDRSRLTIYIRIVGIIVELFEEAFIKNGKFKINLWSVIGSVKKIRSSFAAIKEEIKKLK